ncbi:helix-turn-helix domain-containing protein [Microbacterium testaceum]|uniref:helix-turn-helix domain-containing protein n=1 Tax=Microbacterium testaceum TaxID=2033 RepID=UPI002AC6E273|nr:helix-turn-helix domain-containing protein [Microbacterium testaceum]MDZ5144155.1 helix-turn-helix domain-containing protein [Microbacterium testaceum]
MPRPLASDIDAKIRIRCAAGAREALTERRKPPQKRRLSLVVGLFSSHANELRKAHRSLRRGVCPHRAETTTGARRRVQPRLTDEQVHRIAEGYSVGKTVYELATEFNCHRVTISAVLKRRGIAIRRTSPTNEQVAEMVRLYESGLSLARVGKRFDIHASTVMTQLRKAGIQTRDANWRAGQATSAEPDQG